METTTVAPVTTRRLAQRLATRPRISDTASRLFIERGFDQLTVNEIAEAADVARMTVFNHFSRKALQQGEDPNPYWAGSPQLNTVGYLTGVAGSMAAGYAIGWLVGRFDPPFSRVQINLVSKYLDVQEIDDINRPDCSCNSVRGWADQGMAEALISAPQHWEAPARLA